jgi:integrase
VIRRRYQKGCLFKKGKNWVLRYREDTLNPDGNLGRVHRTVVLGSMRTVREARKAADVHLRKINDGSYRPQSTATLENFWESYFEPEILPTLKYSTRTLYRILTSKHILPSLGGQRLCDIARLHIQQFVGQKQRQGYAPQTLAHLRNLLSKICGTAVRWGWMEFNPCQNIDLPPMERRRPKRFLAPEEISKLARVLAEPARTIFLMGALTGLRIGELLALKVEDVDLGRALVSVRRDVYRGRVGTPKTPGSERRVPLASSLVTLLKRWLKIRPRGSDWLFPSSTGTPLRDRNLMRRHLWPACAQLKLPRFGWHSLRHTFSTYNGNAGVAVPVLQSLLGHASPETTMIYTHPLEDVKRRAVEDLARLLFPNVPSKPRLIARGSELIQ